MNNMKESINNAEEQMSMIMMDNFKGQDNDMIMDMSKKNFRSNCSKVLNLPMSKLH